MPKVVKYGSLAREKMEVNAEALRKSHIGLRAASRDYHLRKDMLSVITWKKLRGCLLRLGTYVDYFMFYET
jgi:hypothetical protein